MYKVMIGAAALLTAILTGCDGVVMLHPLTEDDSEWVVVPGLEGRWQEPNKDDPDYVEFALDANQYKVKARVDGDGMLAFTGGALELDGKVFFCCTLDESVFEQIEDCLDTRLWQAYVIPVHDVVMLEMKDDGLRAGVLDEGWFKGQLKAGTLGVAAHAVTTVDDDWYLLTASSGELQAFFKRVSDMEEAWDYTDTLERVSTKPKEGEPKPVAPANG